MLGMLKKDGLKFTFAFTIVNISLDRFQVQLSPEEEIALFQPVELPLPRSGASFRNLVS